MEKKIKELTETINTLAKNKAEAEGKLKTLEEQLSELKVKMKKDFGVDSVEEAQELLANLNTEVEELTEKIELLLKGKDIEETAEVNLEIKDEVKYTVTHVSVNAHANEHVNDIVEERKNNVRKPINLVDLETLI